MGNIPNIKKTKKEEKKEKAEKQKVDTLSNIEKELNKKRFGAKYEIQQIFDRFGSHFGGLLLNSGHPILQTLLQTPPVSLETPTERKYRLESDRTRTWQG